MLRNYSVLRKYLDLKDVKLPLKETKLKSPVNLFKARQFGYKCKEGNLMYLVKIKKGGIDPQPARKGRKPNNQVRKFSRDISRKEIAIQRLLKKHKNLYFRGASFLKKDKYYHYYEVFLSQKS